MPGRTNRQTAKHTNGQTDRQTDTLNHSEHYSLEDSFANCNRFATPARPGFGTTASIRAICSADLRAICSADFRAICSAYRRAICAADLRAICAADLLAICAPDLRGEGFKEN